jgi:uncharacterized 2Fe-2S/4Fe-4S cluster protein (DUF4445 family)
MQVARVPACRSIRQLCRYRSARRIGLLPFAFDQIHPSGNTALLGAKMALFIPPDRFNTLARSIHHVSLSGLDGFQDTYVEEMLFPDQSDLADHSAP